LRNIHAFAVSCVLSVSCLAYPFGSWHVVGVIGSKMKIQMELHSADSANDVTGSYYYSKYFNTIGLRGSFNKKTGKMLLSEDSSNARFDLRYNPDSNNFAGTWKNKKKQFNVSLTIVASYFTIIETSGNPRDATPTSFPRFCKSVRHFKELNKLTSPSAGLPEGIDAVSNNMLSRFKSDIGPEYGEPTDNSSACEVIYLDSNFLILKTVNIYCGGGASCSHNHCFMNYDLSCNEPHRIDISELFEEKFSFADTLRTVITAKFTGNQEVDGGELEGAIRNKKNDWSCFALYPGFITFIFPEGEMSPRISGPLYDSIPWKRISHLIKRNSAVRFILPE
jgi:hypothetical protein